MLVKEKYRVNPLSSKPAPTTVSVNFTNGSTLEYVNVHYPEKYIAKIISESNGKNGSKVIKSIMYTTHDGSLKTRHLCN